MRLPAVMASLAVSVMQADYASAFSLSVLSPHHVPEINAAGSLVALAAVAALAALVWERRRARSQ